MVMLESKTRPVPVETATNGVAKATKQNERFIYVTKESDDEIDPTTMYLEEIGRIDLLTPEETDRCFRRMEIATASAFLLNLASNRRVSDFETFLPTDTAQRFLRRLKVEEYIKPVVETEDEEGDKKTKVIGFAFTDRDLYRLNHRVKVIPESATSLCEKFIPIGQEAKKRATEGNLRLVVSIAKKSRYVDHGFTLLDRIQEGNIGLIRAVEKFDRRRPNLRILGADNVQFSTYATFWIKEAVWNAITGKGKTIHVPKEVNSQIAVLVEARNALWERKGNAPSVEELASKMGKTPDEIRSLIKVEQIGESPASFETPVSDNGVLGDFIEDPTDVEGTALDNAREALIRRQLVFLINTLRPDKRMILVLLSGVLDDKPMTLRELERRLPISKSRIHQLKDEALQDLQQMEGYEVLREYFEGEV